MVADVRELDDMADVGRSALGLSIGATNLAAVTAERAVTRRPVLTLYRQRPPEVGVPSENPKLNEPGLVITDFVEQVGDPGGIVAADGTTHRSETLVADALRALAYAATDGRALPEAVAVSHPAHWGSAAVEAVRVALSRVSEWSHGRLVLLPDSAAALMSLQANPGLPSRGIIAVCDFGGTGTTLTLVDAANGYQPIAPAVRHRGFSGDLIDQALLTHVIADLSSAGSFDTAATSEVGSLAALRSACRRAKEQLSTTTAVTLTADVPGFDGDIRITRDELDEAIRQPLSDFLTVVHETLQRNGIRATECGGGRVSRRRCQYPDGHHGPVGAARCADHHRAAAASDSGYWCGAAGVPRPGRHRYRVGTDGGGSGRRCHDNVGSRRGPESRAGAGLVGGRRRLRHYADPPGRVSGRRSGRAGAGGF